MEKLQKWIPGIISPVMSAWACAVVSQPRRLHTGRPYAFASAKNVDYSTTYALNSAYMVHLGLCTDSTEQAAYAIACANAPVMMEAA